MVRKLFLTPPVLPAEVQCRSIKIPQSKEWLGIFNAALLQTTMSWQYEQVDATDMTPDEVSALCYEIYVAYLSSEECVNMDCPCPPIFRQGTSGQQQVSFDTGETWSDVATAPLPIPEPIEGQSDQCLSARNLAEVLRLTYLEIVAQFEGGGTILLGIAAFISTLAVTIFFPPAAPAVAIFFGLLWEVLSFLVAGDWTLAVTEELTCIIFNNVTEDAEGRWIADIPGILDAIEAAHPIDNLWAAVGYIIQSAGEYSVQQGLQTRSVQSWDCADCEPPGDIIAFAENGTGWTEPVCTSFRPTTVVTQLSANRWRIEGVDGGDGWYTAIRRSANGSFQVSNITVISGNLFFVEVNIVTAGCSGGGGTILPGVSVYSWTQIGQYALGQLILEFDVLLT